MYKITGYSIVCCFVALSCMKKSESPVVIGINIWPGYEFLYLAEQKGFFKEENISVRLAQLSSLSDTQRAYLAGRVDGFATTLNDAVYASKMGDRPLKIVLVSDYSNGGDVIIGNSSTTTVRDLVGKRVGCELGSLDLYMLHKAMVGEGFSLDDLILVNMDQLSGEQAMLSGTVDALVSYPPVSLSILKNAQFQKIFSSGDIPFEILDVVAVSTEALDRQPNLVRGLHGAWQKALDYTRLNPEEAYEAMSQRQGISSGEFQQLLSDIVIIDQAGQELLFENPDDLQEKVFDMCKVLVDTGSLVGDCDDLPDLIYRRKLHGGL